MRGQWLEAVVGAVIVIAVLVATAHIWGPPLGRAAKRAGHNLNVAGESIFRTVKRLFGQGSVRPHRPGKG